MCLPVIKAKKKYFTIELTLCNGEKRKNTMSEKEYLQLKNLFQIYDIGIKSVVIVATEKK